MRGTDSLLVGRDRRAPLLLLTTAALAIGAPSAHASALRVIPFPGTPDAAPGTQIIFSALAPSEIRAVTVTGSRSGSHGGRLTALPDGTGSAFVPSARFTPGEHVTVRAALSAPAAGTASGEPGATGLSFSFAIGRVVGRRAQDAVNGTGATARGSGSSARATRSFRSAPGLNPPKVTVAHDPDQSSGDIFLAPFNTPDVGPMILDSQGHLVWYHPLATGQALNLQVQSYRHQPVLTWWRGGLSATHGTIYGLGRDVIMNRSYRTVAVVRAANGYSADLHEFQITPQGTALLDAYVPVHENLTSLGGPSNGTVLDCVVQEVDIETGRLLWEWHSLGHVALTASHIPVINNPRVWFDYFHINSIQQLAGGNLLISSRSTWGIYEISHTTGRVIWRLGGKHSSFKMGPGTNFEWQHDARMHPGGLLSLLDDASSPQEERESSAKLLKINTQTMTATLVHRYPHTPPVLSGLAGNTELLPNGNIFVGWGGAPDFSEYTPAGRQIFNGRFAGLVGSYRAFRFPWTAHPQTRPAMASAAGKNGRVTIYASWNGATQVVAWRVLGGQRPGALHSLGPATGRTGFQTAITLATRPRFLAVQALGRGGRVLGTSDTHTDAAGGG